jgi:hypothetical protein
LDQTLAKRAVILGEVDDCNRVQVLLARVDLASEAGEFSDQIASPSEQNFFGDSIIKIELV